MVKYVELPPNKKLNLLRAHGFGCEWPNLEQENWCLHCEQKFTGQSVRVWQDASGALWLECGTPDCSGSPIDWAPYPWWDPKHPATKAQEKKSKPKRSRRSRKRDSSAEDDVPF
jgi:hypothetical protein